MKKIKLFIFFLLLINILTSCTHIKKNITDSKLKNPSLNGDLYKSEDINWILINQLKDENVFLYAYDEVENEYKNFLLKSGYYSVNFNSTCSKMEEWSPIIYLSDFTGDGENEIIVIITTGSGTGVHTEDIFIYDCDLKVRYEVTPILDVIDSIINITKTNESYIISSEFLEKDYIISKDELGEPMDRLVDEPYYHTMYKYHIKNGYLYAVVGIGIGFLEYYEKNIIIKYKCDVNSFIFDNVYIDIL